MDHVGFHTLPLPLSSSVQVPHTGKFLGVVTMPLTGVSLQCWQQRLFWPHAISSAGWNLAQA